MPEFGEWVRKLRVGAGLTQAEAAKELDFRQPYWSKIEQQGAVPDDAGLIRISTFFEQDLDELRDLLRQATELDDLERRLTREFEAFKSWLKTLAPPVRLFVIRQDAEVYDPELVSWHHEILRDTPGLTITILFRFPKADVWGSFVELFGFVRDAFSNNSDRENLKNRLRGYYRRESVEEREEPSKGISPIPMSQPVVLVIAGEPRNALKSIFTYGYHWLSEVEFRGSRASMASFRHRNLVLSAPVDQSRADSFVRWIKLGIDLNDPPETHWESIGTGTGY